MVPRVTSKGKSFRGAGAYFLHDLGKADTDERVAFTHTVNMLTDDPEKAIKVMAWTAEHAADLKAVAGIKATGRQSKDAVYNYVLAWAPDQNPERAEMVAFGQRSLEALGLGEHEALFVAHNDTDHKHLHIIANRVHPVTGKMATLYNDQLVLSRLAQDYEQEQGRIYCHERVTNNRGRELGDYVKGANVIRLSETPEYQARRLERMEAQRKATEHHAARLEAAERKSTAARDLRADFDQASARDAEQYRARDLKPANDDQAAASAWADEQAKERERAKGERDRARLTMKEKRRVAWLTEKRATEWADYEARQWQTLNDKQTERREGLRELQATARVKVEERLGRKYGPNGAVLDRRIADLTADLERKGAGAILARITGQRADKVRKLEALEKAKVELDAQRKREAAAYEAKQRAQRDEQAKRQDAERVRLAERLAATKSRQDAQFIEREAARAKRLGPASPARVDFNSAAREREAEAQQAAVRAQIAAKERERLDRTTLAEAIGHAAWRSTDKSQGYGR